MTRRPRVIALYLPQYHPIPENDRWWGKGFTEWTNVARAKPLYAGHRQPRVPADLGFYDLRLPEARAAQAALAKAHGIEAFCYWHYWFGDGRQLLERPLREVVASGSPDFPFCVAWANESWTGKWHGAPDRKLAVQTYPGRADHERHFHSLLPAFRDPRYVTVDGRRLFLIFKPASIPDLKGFLDLWNDLAAKERIDGFYFVAIETFVPGVGFSGFIDNLPFLRLPRNGYERFKALLDRTFGEGRGPAPDTHASDGKQSPARRPAALDDQEVRGIRRLVRRAEDGLHLLVRRPRIYRYRDYVRHFATTPAAPFQHPVLIPNWDNTPRSGFRGAVLDGSTPELFEELCTHAAAMLRSVPDDEHRLVFVKSWNEWAEGNYLEPDLDHGLAYLEALVRGLGL